MCTFCHAGWFKCLFGRRKENIFSTRYLQHESVTVLHRLETEVILNSGEQMVLKNLRQYAFPSILGQVQVFMPGIVKRTKLKKKSQMTIKYFPNTFIIM